MTSGGWWGMLATTAGGGVGPPTYDTYFNDSPINVSWSTPGGGGSPAPIGGTFHDGTPPGSWTLITDSELGTTAGYDWQIEITATVSHTGATCGVLIQVQPGTNPADAVTIFHVTMADGDSLPLTYTGVFADVSLITLPVLQETFAAPTTTIVGAITFTWVP